MTTDPPRLLDDPTAGAALRGDLLHASEAQLHGFDFAAGLAQLQSATGTGAVATVATTSLTAKLGVTGLIAAAAAALWVGSRDPSPPTVQASAPATVPADVVEAEEADAEPTVVAPSLDPTPVPPPHAETPVLSPAPTDAVTERPTSTADPIAPSEPEALEPEPPEPIRKHVRKSPPSEPAETPAPTDDRVIREARALAQARSKLSGDPAAALALLEDAEQEFPAGQLVEERRALAIQALAALGRHDEAKRRAEAFLAKYGKGAHAAAVRRAIAAQP